MFFPGFFDEENVWRTAFLIDSLFCDIIHVFTVILNNLVYPCWIKVSISFLKKSYWFQFLNSSVYTVYFYIGTIETNTQCKENSFSELWKQWRWVQKWPKKECYHVLYFFSQYKEHWCVLETLNAHVKAFIFLWYMKRSI